MTFKLSLDRKHLKFLFDESAQFNAFNLVRLMRPAERQNEVLIDLRALTFQQQDSILSSAKTFLNLVASLLSAQEFLMSFVFSTENLTLVKKVSIEIGGEFDEKKIICEVSKLPVETEQNLDPHTVKNIRGAVFLSLVQDLISIRKIERRIDFFTETSSITLHASSSFLSNKENAELMWSLLKQWEREHGDEHNTKLNHRLYQCLQNKDRMLEKAKSSLNSFSIDGNLKYLVEFSQSKLGLPNSVFQSYEQLVVWMIDDQWANGWKQLIESLLAGTNIELEAFSSLQGVKQSIALANFDATAQKPHLAIVDLRLNSDDPVVEDYNSKDLSGFGVVEELLEAWQGLPIMIASASSKLWNLEKAIQKGASAYWRKSDESTYIDNEQIIFTTLDIYSQFIDKVVLTLSKVKYRNVYDLSNLLNAKCNVQGFKYAQLKVSINQFNFNLSSKVSWMLWHHADEQGTLDSLLLDTMAIFNEIEPLLWDEQTNKLTLFPEKEVTTVQKGKDSRIVNDTLSYLDENYRIGGIAFESSFNKVKQIRNKLNVIHGSETAQNVTHATIRDIELVLLIIWVLLVEVSNSPSS